MTRPGDDADELEARGSTSVDTQNGAGGTADAPEPKRSGPLAALRETVILVALAVGLAVLFKTFLVQAFYIPSASMEPTLQVSDRVLVEKVSYRFRDVHPGDIIVFVQDDGIPDPSEPSNPVARVLRGIAQAVGLAPPSERDFIKRVVGTPGDRLSCRGGELYRNGQPVPEPYLEGGTPTECEPLVVPDGKLFVMGDNRTNSQDSRVFGPIDRSQVVGRAFARIWPITRFGGLGP